MDIGSFLAQRLTYGNLPPLLMVYLSWTCAKFRKIAIEYAKASTVRVGKNDVFSGRWMLHHGAKLAEWDDSPECFEMVSSVPFIRSRGRPPNIPLNFDSAHAWMASFTKMPFYSIPADSKTPSVSMFEFLFEHHEGLSDMQASNLVYELWFRNHPWSCEHLALFARLGKYTNLIQLCMEKLVQNQEHDVARAIALERGGLHFTTVIRIFDTHPATVEELTPVSKTDISGIFRQDGDKRPLSNEFLFTLLGTGYRNDYLTEYLSKRNGRAFRYAYEKGFRPDDAFLSRIIHLCKGKKFIDFLKSTFGLSLYAECISLPIDTGHSFKPVRLEDCSNEKLSPEAALKIIQMNPRAKIYDTNMQALLEIALDRQPEKKKRDKKQKEGGAKRRKINESF